MKVFIERNKASRKHQTDENTQNQSKDKAMTTKVMEKQNKETKEKKNNRE